MEEEEIRPIKRIHSRGVCRHSASINMALEITPLGSGSRGNSTLLRSGSTMVLIDCGFSLKQLELRLSRINVNPLDIDGIFITHHHSDHAKSAKRASEKWDAILHCNPETAVRMGWAPISECRTFGNVERIQISDGMSLLPIPIPHDDADNVAVIATNGDGHRAAIVTDLGEATHELKRHLNGCSHISIEANYDEERLMNGPYPHSLKRRISGRGGHLSNLQTAEILQDIMNPKLQSIVLCHLSEKNNAPHLAESEVLMHIGEEYSGTISISTQDGPDFTIRVGELKNEDVKIRL